MLQPNVLLLDEPLSNLDAKLRAEMRFELKRIQHETGVTTLFVTHDQEEALTMSDRIVVMNQGRVHQIGTPREVWESPQDAFVADFLGLENLLDGQVVERDKQGRTVVRLENSELLSVQHRAVQRSARPAGCAGYPRPPCEPSGPAASFGGQSPSRRHRRE